MLDFVKRGFQHVLHRADEIVGKAVEIALASSQNNRDEAARLDGELAEVEARQTRLVELLMDRGIGDAAKAAVNRQLTEAEGQRKSIQAARDALHDQANANTEELASTIRELLEAAGDNLASITAPEAYNRFAEQLVGPIEVRDGKPTQKLLGDNLLSLPIAGGGFEPPTSGL